MLNFFTDPYDDEILYSVLARYHYYSGNFSMRETLIQAFGDESALPSISVPCRIGYLSSQLSNEVYTAEYLIKKHTILPYYLPFMDRDRKDRVINFVKGAGGKALFTLIGMAAGGFCKKAGLCYCPMCASEDFNCHGEAYFHRIHQLEGVLVCDRHGSRLKEYPIAKDKVSRLAFIRFTSGGILNDKVDSDHDKSQPERHLWDKLHEVAKGARVLLKGDYFQSDNTKVYENLTLWLCSKGYLTRNRRVRQKEFCHDLKAFYGERVLDILESNFDPQKDYTWPCEAVRRPRQSIHPLRYMLIALFLMGDVERLFRPPILEQGVTHSDPLPKNKFDTAWRLKFAEVIKSGGSLRGIACEMGCDPKTIVKYAQNLGLEEFLDTSMKVYVPKGKARKTDYAIEAETISQYLKQNPGCTRNEVRKRLGRQYMRLYKHQRELLYSILPKKVKQLPAESKRVDWRLRDAGILEPAKAEYIRLLFTAEPVRISFSQLAKGINYPSLRFYLNKLPLTKQFIEKVLESTEDFQLRRVDYVCHKISREKGIFDKWEVMRLAGLKESVSEKVLTRIKNNLEKFNDLEFGEENAKNCFQELAVSQLSQGHALESWESNT